MPEIFNKKDDDLRFFSPPKQESTEISTKANERTPFGLNLESPQKSVGDFTMGPSVTNAPGGSDNCLDVDVNF